MLFLPNRKASVISAWHYSRNTSERWSWANLWVLFWLLGSDYRCRQFSWHFTHFPLVKGQQWELWDKHCKERVLWMRMCMCVNRRGKKVSRWGQHVSNRGVINTVAISFSELRSVLRFLSDARGYLSHNLLSAKHSSCTHKMHVSLLCRLINCQKAHFMWLHNLWNYSYGIHFCIKKHFTNQLKKMFQSMLLLLSVYKGR